MLSCLSVKECLKERGYEKTSVSSGTGSSYDVYSHDWMRESNKDWSGSGIYRKDRVNAGDDVAGIWESKALPDLRRKSKWILQNFLQKQMEM